jgi:hypothetical protein
LPVREPEQLVHIQNLGSNFALQQLSVKSGEIFEGVLATAGAEPRDVNTGTGQVELVSGNFFPLLGSTAWIGRTIAPEDDIRRRPQAPAVLSYSRRNSNTQLGADGFQAEAGEARNAYWDQVGPNYLRRSARASWPRLQRARFPRERQGHDRQSVVRALLFPNQDPIGRNCSSSSGSHPRGRCERPFDRHRYRR